MLHNVIPFIHKPFHMNLKVNARWNVLAKCRTVDVNALDHKMRWLKCRDAQSVKHSAHKHKTHVCKVCLKWKT